MDAAQVLEVNEQPVELSKGETDDLLELVEAKKQTRMGRLIPAKQVPKILLPYQARWHADMAVVRLAEKSRRIGWSWGALAAEGALEAALPKGNPRGMDQFYMGYNMAMAAENIGDVQFFAEAYGFAVSEISVRRHREEIARKADDGAIIRSHRDITTYKIKFASGHVYEALSSNPHNWRGRQGHARIDEAAFHDNLQEVVKAALAFRLWGGRIDVVSTHNGDDNQFNLWVREIKVGKLNWSRHFVDFDGALREGFYKRICLVTGQEWSQKAEARFREEAFADYPDQADANEELLCIPKKGSGSYFPRTLLENCQDDSTPVIRYTQPAEWYLDDRRLEQARKWFIDNLKPVIDNLPGHRTVLGRDFGRSGDLSVNWVLQRENSQRWRTAFVLELRRIPFDVQQLILFSIIDELPLFHHAKLDARGNGEQLAEAAEQRYGAGRVECVKATSNWYATNFPPYKSAYEDQSITIPKSEDIIADHRRVVLYKGIPRMDDGRDKGSDGEYRHGDTAVAGLLAWAATREEGEPAFGADIEPDMTAFEPDSARGRARATMFGRRTATG